MTRDQIEKLEAGWPEAEILVIDRANIEKLEALARAIDSNDDIRWSPLDYARALAHTGWELVFEHGKVVMNKARDRVLLMRKKDLS
jgi:hypothetical protein